MRYRWLSLHFAPEKPLFEGPVSPLAGFETPCRPPVALFVTQAEPGSTFRATQRAIRLLHNPVGLWRKSGFGVNAAWHFVLPFCLNRYQDTLPQSLNVQKWKGRIKWSGAVGGMGLCWSGQLINMVRTRVLAFSHQLLLFQNWLLGIIIPLSGEISL